jgi:hypothetical protein
VWQPSAERELTELWLSAADQTAISAVSNRVDRELGFDPFAIGESRDGNRRIVIFRPLVVSFTVYENDRIVRVTKVRLLGGS